MIAPLILATVAMWAGGKPAAITCDQARGANAHTVVGSSEITLGVDVCRGAAQGEGIMVAVLLHETRHAMGSPDELVATCFSLHYLRRTLRRFWHFKPQRVEREYRDAADYFSVGPRDC